MKYKSFLKNCTKNNDNIGIISLKLEIIRWVEYSQIPIKEICKKYSMGRNTVGNLLKMYREKSCNYLQEKMRSFASLSAEELEKYWYFLLPKSRKPKSNKRQATKKEEEAVLEFFWKNSFGTKRLQYTARWWGNSVVANMSLGKIRGIFKRNNLRVSKVKTKSGPCAPWG